MQRIYVLVVTIVTVISVPAWAHDPESHSESHDSSEWKTTLTQEALDDSGITIGEAGPAKIYQTALIYGRILPNEDRVAHLSARFAGIITEIRKSLGDRVQRGETLAVVESNQSLQRYELKSLLDGVVIDRHAAVGELVSESVPIFVVADLSQVWVDFQVYRDDIATNLTGKHVSIDFGREHPNVEATISYVSPLTDEVTQSRLVRAVLPNTAGDLRPGLFVSGTLKVSDTPVTLSVRKEAIQRLGTSDVVFLAKGRTFQGVTVKLGAADSENVEILSGISVGDRYVATNSYIIKADIEKAGAAHEH